MTKGVHFFILIIIYFDMLIYHHAWMMPYFQLQKFQNQKVSIKVKINKLEEKK